jgi:hypothetical protein
VGICHEGWRLEPSAFKPRRQTYEIRPRQSERRRHTGAKRAAVLRIERARNVWKVCRLSGAGATGMADDLEVRDQRLMLQMRTGHDGVVAHEGARMQKHAQQRQ